MTTEELQIVGKLVGTCDVHDWPTEGMVKRLVEAMRDRHGKGGVDVCRECINRAHASLPTRRQG